MICLCSTWLYVGIKRVMESCTLAGRLCWVNNNTRYIHIIGTNLFKPVVQIWWKLDNFEQSYAPSKLLNIHCLGVWDWNRRGNVSKQQLVDWTSVHSIWHRDVFLPMEGVASKSCWEVSENILKRLFGQYIVYGKAIFNFKIRWFPGHSLGGRFAAC